MSIKVGLLVEFMQDNTPTLGYVLDEQGGKNPFTACQQT